MGSGRPSSASRCAGSETELACRAILAALDDAGVGPDEVDGLCSYTMEATEEVDIARNLGLGDITFFSQVGYGGGAGCATVGHAAMAVATGQARTVVAWRSRKRGSGPRPWASRVVASPRPSPGRGRGACSGRSTRSPCSPVATCTSTARPATTWRMSHSTVGPTPTATPHAVMHAKPMTRDDYMNARWISEPLCLFDNCLETDGALAAVVTSTERARDLKQPVVTIHSFGQGIPRQHQTMTNYFNEDPLAGPSYACADVLWRQAEVRPDDVDVAQLYDAFSPLIPLSWEGYGFCKRGEGKDYDRVPYNTSGSGLSEAYVHGFNLISEGVRQMRGTSTGQVDGAEVCLVTSGEGVPTSALLLTKQ